MIREGLFGDVTFVPERQNKGTLKIPSRRAILPNHKYKIPMQRVALSPPIFEVNHSQPKTP